MCNETAYNGEDFNLNLPSKTFLKIKKFSLLFFTLCIRGTNHKTGGNWRSLKKRDTQCPSTSGTTHSSKLEERRTLNEI